ncbi:MAG: nucleotidyltransferase domain-containing protein [Gammaproteobacteria bacterium]
MRLSAKVKSALLECFKNHFPSGTELWIFGSRVDDTALGGDLDLYVEYPKKKHPESLVFKEAYDRKLKFLVELKSKIGHQKIDLVLNLPGISEELPIYTIAKQEGIRLI